MILLPKKPKTVEDVPLPGDDAVLGGQPPQVGSATMHFPGKAPIQIELSELDMVVCPLEDYESERIVEKVIEMLGELEHRGYKNQLLENDLMSFDFTPGPYYDITDAELLQIIGEAHDEADRRKIDLNEHPEYTHGWNESQRIKEAGSTAAEVIFAKSLSASFPNLLKGVTTTNG